MGGGAILRGFAKAAATASSASAAAPSRAPLGITGIGSAVAGGCSRCVSAPMMLAQAPADVGASRLRLGVADDWEFAGDEERREYAVRDHLVFGTLPSRDEVEDATSELQTALGMCVGDYQTQDSSFFTATQEPLVSSSTHAANHELHKEEANNQLGNSVLDWIEPQLVTHGPGNVQVRRRSDVADAFHLLQTDPTVRGVVMSIASDKAVWEAVLSNEKVKEFRKKLTEPDVTFVVSEDGERLKQGNFFTQLFDYSKNAFVHLKSAVREMINSLLSFADKNLFSGKDGDVGDRAVKSCFMLGVIVLSLVLLKRATVVV